MSRLQRAIESVRLAVQGPPEPEPPALREDFETWVRSSGGWGCHISLRGRDEVTGVYNVWAHTPWRPTRGDCLLVLMASGQTAAFVLWNIDYKRDPPDMWEAEAHPIGYVADAVAPDALPTSLLSDKVTRQLLL